MDNTPSREPTAEAAAATQIDEQARLLLYERIARSLFRLVGSEEGVHIWLNTPEPDLDNEVPRDLILNGEGEAVAELLEDMQVGQSG